VSRLGNLSSQKKRMTRDWTPILKKVKATFSPKLIVWDNRAGRKKYKALEHLSEQQVREASVNYADTMKGFQLELKIYKDDVVTGTFATEQQAREFILAYPPNFDVTRLFTFSLYCFHKLNQSQHDQLRKSYPDAHATWRRFYSQFAKWWDDLVENWKGRVMDRLRESHGLYKQEKIERPSAELALSFLLDSQYLTLELFSRSPYEKFVCLVNEDGTKYIISHYVKGLSWLLPWKRTEYVFAYFALEIIKNGSKDSFETIYTYMQEWNVWTRANTLRSLF
jgi:hypothetical protein